MTIACRILHGVPTEKSSFVTELLLTNAKKSNRLLKTTVRAKRTA